MNTQKIVAAVGDHTQGGMGYWPNYSDITPTARRAYLNWLVGGRRDPAADIGYVFLFFYGLERRAILDASKDPAAQADWPQISEELRRLLAIYGHNQSFHDYATNLLLCISLGGESTNLYKAPLPNYERGFVLPFHLRLVLGECALDKAPVPPQAAFAWVQMDPSHYLRTPAIRCAKQFEQLFIQKYKLAFGEGLLLPINKTKLKFPYRPASSALRGSGEINLTFGDVPDVSVLTGPIKKLHAIAEATIQEIDSYSRYIGRNPQDAESLEALLLLPASLWPEILLEQLRAYMVLSEQGPIAMKLADLLTTLGAKSAPTKDKLTSIARALETLDLALEPDILAGAKPPKREDTIVLFTRTTDDVASRNSPAYQTAVLTVQLASAVAGADGEVSADELRELQSHVDGWKHLTPGHQQRLRAHMRLLVDAPISLVQLKKKLEPMEISSKVAIAKFMAVIAQADGIVTPSEIKMLEKVYKVLGVDPSNVFSDVHSIASNARPPEGSASARQPGGAAAGTQSAGAINPAFKLDAAKIAALRKDTEQVSALLANIFKEDEPAPVAAPVPVREEQGEQEVTTQAVLPGLDEAHSSFARLLLSRPNWTRQELLDIASDLELMLDGALERVNDASFDAHDMPLTEGEDPVTVNQEILQKATV